MMDSGFRRNDKKRRESPSPDASAIHHGLQHDNEDSVQLSAFSYQFTNYKRGTANAGLSGHGLGVQTTGADNDKRNGGQDCPK